MLVAPDLLPKPCPTLDSLTIDIILHHITLFLAKHRQLPTRLREAHKLQQLFPVLVALELFLHLKI